MATPFSNSKFGTFVRELKFSTHFSPSYFIMKRKKMLLILASPNDKSPDLKKNETKDNQ